jgi:glutathione synthase/RimK-type ligase-like ATP-grasp enzyme
MTPAVTVALATAAHLPSGMADTPSLITALAGSGVAVQVRAWDDPEADWRQFALVVPHCTWDYLERFQDFRRWLRVCERRGLLPNALPLLDWVTDKAYLLELAAQGIAIPPTARFERGDDASPGWLRERFGGAPLVVKPSVGGGGHRVWRCAGPGEAAEVARTQLPAEGVLVQAFQPAVTTDGEYSAVFVAGRLSHVVRKRPQQGDFRVHRRYGATRELAGVEPWMAGYCRRVLAAARSMPLYARVDFLLPRPAEPVLMELEVLEPDLYLRECPGAGARFAAALATRARQLPERVSSHP